MISLKITPPADIKVPQPNIYDAYNHFMQGETAIGRGQHWRHITETGLTIRVQHFMKLQ